jgi:hypothetical protein
MDSQMCDAIFWDIALYSPYVTLKMEVICSSETSGRIRTTRRYITDDGNIHNYRCENLKSCFVDS